MKSHIKITCILCGKTFEPGNTKGLPNGLGFQMQSGETYNACTECISYRNDELIRLIKEKEEVISS